MMNSQAAKASPAVCAGDRHQDDGIARLERPDPVHHAHVEEVPAPRRLGADVLQGALGHARVVLEASSAVTAAPSFRSRTMPTKVATAPTSRRPSVRAAISRPGVEGRLLDAHVRHGLSPR